MGCCFSKSDGRLYTQDAQMLELTGSARKPAASDVSDGVLSGVTEVGAALGTGRQAGARTPPSQGHGPRSAYYADQDPTLVALKRGIVKFNFQAKQGIEYLSRVGLLPAPGSPGAAQAVASFFYTGGGIPQDASLAPPATSSPAAAAAASPAAAGQGLKRVSEPLSKRSIGEYLGTAGKDEESRRWHREVLEAYCQLFTFTGMELVPALRTFLSAFHLPGEAQVIDRLMTRFAATYHRDNPPAPAPGAAGPAGAQQARLETVTASPGMELTTGPMLPLSPSLPRSMQNAAKGAALLGTRAGAKAGAGTAAVPAPIHGAAPPAPAAPGRGSGRWSPFLTPDTPYILAFGAIMLNTDLHKASLVANTHSKPMTRAQFVRNMMGVVSPPSSSSSSATSSTGASGAGASASPPAPPTNPYIGPSICPDTGCLLSPLDTAERVFVSVYEDIAATPLALETTADSAHSAHGAGAGGAGKMGAKGASLVQHDSYYSEYANVTFFAPAKQGWLSKKGSHGLRTWKRRWFLLTDGCLYYFPSPAAVATAQPRCILPLDNAQVLSAGTNGLRIIPQEGADTVSSSVSSAAPAARTGTAHTHHAVVLKSAKRLSSGAIIRGQHSEFILRAASKSERDGWLAALSAHAVRAPMQKLRRQSTVRARGALLSVARLPTLTSNDLEDKAADLVGVGGGSRLSLLHESAAVQETAADGEKGPAAEEGGPDADTPRLIPQTHSQHSSQGRATIGSSGPGSDVRRSASGTARASGQALSMAFKHESAVVEGNSSVTVLVDLAASSGFSQPASASSALEGSTREAHHGAQQLAEEEEGVANLLHPASSDTTTTMADTMSAIHPHHPPLVSGLPSPSAHLQLLHLTREALRVHETPAPASAIAASSIRAPQLGTAAASLRTPSMGSERSAPASPLPSLSASGVAVGAGVSVRPPTGTGAPARPAVVAELPHPYSAQGFTAHSISGGGSEKGDRESGSLPFETASDVSSVDGAETHGREGEEDFHFDEEEEEEAQGLPTADSPLDGHGGGHHFHARSPLHSPQWGGQLLDQDEEEEAEEGEETGHHGHGQAGHHQQQQQQQGERSRARQQRGHRRSLRGLSSDEESYGEEIGENSALQAPSQSHPVPQHHTAYGGIGGAAGAGSGNGNSTSASSTIGAGISARLQTVGAGVRSLASAVLKPSPSATASGVTSGSGTGLGSSSSATGTGSAGVRVGSGGEKGLSHAHHRSLTGTLLGGGQTAIPVTSYSSGSASASVHARGEEADAEEPGVPNTSFGSKSVLGHKLQGVVEGVGGGLRDGLGMLLGGSAAAAGFSRTLRSDSDAEALEGDRVLPPSSAGPLQNVSSLSLSAATGGLPTPLPPPKQRVIVHPSATAANSGSGSGGGSVSNRVKLAGPGLSRQAGGTGTGTPTSGKTGGAQPMKPLPPPIPHSPQTSAVRTGSAPSPSLGPLNLSVGGHQKQTPSNPSTQGQGQGQGWGGQGQLPSVLSGADVLGHTSSSTAAPAHASGAAALAASSGLPPAGPHTAHTHHMRSVSTISSSTAAGTTGQEGGKVAGHSRKTRSLADQVDSGVED